MRHLYLPIADDATIVANRDNGLRLIARRVAFSELKIIRRGDMGQNQRTNRVGVMTGDEIFEAIDSALAEVSDKLALGELNGSGRFITDEELAAGAATGTLKKKDKSEAAPAA